MSKLHLTAKVPNEGARRLAWWLGERREPVARDPLTGERVPATETAIVNLSRRLGTTVDYVERLLAGELIPGSVIADLIGQATAGDVTGRDWMRKPAGGWFDRPVARALAKAAQMPAGVIIDTEGDPGSWATAIAHTPHLAAQVQPIARGGIPPLAVARAGEAVTARSRRDIASPDRCA